MRQSGSNDAAHYQKNHRKNRIWKTAVMVLSSIVVFCTTYALILPAITMSRETICGIEEHIHTEKCYQEQETVPQTVLVCSPEHARLHTHTETCYDDSGRSICGYADFVLHTHDEGCYDNSGVLVCGLPEIEAHTHDESCYAPPHSHDASCYSLQKGALICTTPEGETHAHTDACFASQQNLVCSLEEIPAHHHTADCYVETSVLACSLEGEPDHVHDEACYTVSRELSCGKEETDGHTHSDACYQMTDVPVCGLDEETPHTHADACYAWESVLTCTQLTEEEGALPQLVCDLPEVIPHIHDETCFDADGYCTCGLLQVEEHVHDSTCFAVKQVPAEAPVLICGKEEHQHSDACYPAQEAMEPDGDPSEKDTNGTVYDCGLSEHLHSEDCYSTETGTLLCTMPEHLHSEECGAMPGEPEDGITELSYSGGDYTVSVVYGPEAGLPQGVTLLAEEILPDTEEYREYYTQSVEALDPASWSQPQTLVFARFFDVWFELDGEVYEPEAPVSVTITYDDGVEIGRTEECQAIHFAEDGPEILEVDTEDSRDGATSFTHTQDGFSVMGTLMTTTAYSLENPADAGPDKLPVDYYVYIDGEWTCVGTTKTGWYAPADASGWENTNRDCITVDQAASKLGAYGFDPNAANNAALQIAYQRKETDKDANLHCDTQSYTDATKSNAALIPLARNADPASGYNVYFLPGNTNNNYSYKLETVAVSGSEFYTVSVYDPNHLAYAEEDAIPGTQTIRTGGNAKVTVKVLPENSGAVWQCVNDKWETVASDQDKGDGTVTFSIRDITQKLCITPMVNNLGTAVQKTVYFMVFLDGQWQNVGTTTPYYQNSNLLISGDKYRHFITSSQAESVLAPFGFRSSQYSSTVGGTSVLAHQLGQYDLNKEFWTDGGGQKLSDSSWAIGLSYQTNGSIDYSVYYLPSNPEAFQGKKPSNYTADSAEMSSNSFWSVSVRDDTNSVYSDGELSGMVQIVKPGGEATVTVQNGDGILWSVSGASDVTSEQAGGYTTFTIKNITQPVEVVATKANPSFTVQYYANIDRYVLGDSGNLEVIDTSGKKLPKNNSVQKDNNGNITNTGQTLQKLTLEDINRTTDQNQGNATPLKKVKSEKRLTQMYTDGTYNFEEHPGLEYFDKLWEKSNYKLDAVLVLKDGRSPDSMNDGDWWWYQINQTTWNNITFTNIASEENAPRQEGVKQGRDGTYCILLEEGTVLRLRYETGDQQTYTNQANFHDYDITSGQNDNGTWRSGITGINHTDNYVTSRNGKRKFNGTHDVDAAKDVFAFGNANCETGLGLAQWGGNNINAYNGTNVTMSDGSEQHFGNDVYKGCTFGLVTGLDENGNLIWDPWITAPHLFNDGTANGKHSYNNGSLQFYQTGDTYTLTAANSSVGSRSNLEYFFNPSPSASKTHTHIFTNNFWPMDSASNKTDPLMGAINSSGTCDVKVNGFWDEQNKVGKNHDGVRVPISDDGRAHNWFFGMNFSLSFTLTEDYTGPLEYIFFGDDDLWVFLDKTLICDIGGVHSSVGEYVNLRDYLPNGSSGQHTLSFFYTERGASGSTCWMSFTLPSVTSAATGQNTGSLQIAKSLEGTGDVDFTGEEYRFKVELLTTENGSGLNQTFSYSRSDGTYGTIKSGGTIALKKDENVTISGIPTGTFYRVTEESRAGYKVTANGSEGYIVSGKIETGAIKPAAFVNTPYYELPSTGGGGTEWYTAGGLCLMAAAGLLYAGTRLRRKGGRDSPWQVF